MRWRYVANLKSVSTAFGPCLKKASAAELDLSISSTWNILYINTWPQSTRCRCNINFTCFTFRMEEIINYMHLRITLPPWVLRFVIATKEKCYACIMGLLYCLHLCRECFCPLYGIETGNWSLAYLSAGGSHGTTRNFDIKSPFRVLLAPQRWVIMWLSARLPITYGLTNGLEDTGTISLSAYKELNH